MDTSDFDQLYHQKKKKFIFGSVDEQDILFSSDNYYHLQEQLWPNPRVSNIWVGNRRTGSVYQDSVLGSALAFE